MGRQMLSAMLILLLPGAVMTLRCYEDASLSNVTSAEITVEFQNTSWRSMSTFPDGLRQVIGGLSFPSRVEL
jgi:hypothetical protein